VADVLAWDRERGEPPLDRGFIPEQEHGVLARYGPQQGRMWHCRSEANRPEGDMR
jgi:hypothetical protein